MTGDTGGTVRRLQAVADAAFARSCLRGCTDHCLSAAENGYQIKIETCDAGRLKRALAALHDDDMPDDEVEQSAGP